MSVEADYVYTGMRTLLVAINATSPTTPRPASNYPFTDIARLPYPGLGLGLAAVSTSASPNYHALQIGFTKRMSNRWQASATICSRASGTCRTRRSPGCQYVTTLNAAGQPVCDVPVTLRATDPRGVVS